MDVQKRKGILFVEDVSLNPNTPNELQNSIKEVQHLTLSCDLLDSSFLYEKLCGALIYSNAVCHISKVYADHGSPVWQ